MSVRKIPYTKAIPANAETFTRKGKRFVRFKSRGKTVAAPLSDDAQRIRLMANSYYGEVNGVAVKLSTEDRFGDYAG